MNLFELNEPTTDVVLYLNEHKGEPMVALYEASLEFGLPIEEIVAAYRRHLVESTDVPLQKGLLKPGKGNMMDVVWSRQPIRENAEKLEKLSIPQGKISRTILERLVVIGRHGIKKDPDLTRIDPNHLIRFGKLKATQKKTTDPSIGQKEFKSLKYPVVVEFKGIGYILDGHGRIGNAIKKNTQIKVHWILGDLDKINEGDVIGSKFTQRLGQKRGMHYDPNLEPPLSYRDGKPFDRFELKKSKDGRIGSIIGVRSDGYEEPVGTSNLEIAKVLASAYNAGGWTSSQVEKVRLGEQDKPKARPWSALTLGQIKTLNQMYPNGWQLYHWNSVSTGPIDPNAAGARGSYVLGGEHILINGTDHILLGKNGKFKGYYQWGGSSLSINTQRTDGRGVDKFKPWNRLVKDPEDSGYSSVGPKGEGADGRVPKFNRNGRFVGYN